MTAFRHAGSDGISKADGARCRLRLWRSQYLEDRVPFEILVSVNALSMIVPTRIDNEAIVCVHISGDCQYQAFQTLYRVAAYLALSTAW